MADASFCAFVASLAARTPAPGGGAAAARGAAMGAALCAMVLRFSIPKPANAPRKGELESALATIDGLITQILPLDDLDMAAFTRVLEAYRLPKSEAAESQRRDAAIQSALADAMQVPEQLCVACRDVLVAIGPVADCIGRNIVADLGTGAELLLAAARAAELMVGINAGSVADPGAAASARQRIAALVTDVAARRAKLRQRVDELMTP